MSKFALITHLKDKSDIMQRLRKRLFSTALLMIAGISIAPAQTNEDARQRAIKIADRIIESTTYDFINKKTGEEYTTLNGVEPTKDIKVKSKYLDWHYTNGVTNLALMELGDKLNTKKYENFVYKNMSFIFDENNQDFFKKLYEETLEKEGWLAVRSINWHMIYRNKRLDDNGPMGASLIVLNERHPSQHFQQYIEQTRQHLTESEPRLSDGTIARLWPHENTIWADDAYMALSFLVNMGATTGENRYFDDAAHQIISYTNYLWCKEKQLYYHCFHTDTKQNGVAHWSRANGWVFMATADLLQKMPTDHPKRKEILRIFNQQAEGVARYQGANGLWHQLLDKTDSYEEVTGTAMFVFGMARGVKAGWLHPDFIHVAWQGLKGMMSKISPEGDITAICAGTGIMPSLAFYYNRPQWSNDPMGDGPVLRALIEMIDAPAYTSIKAEAQYDKIK